MCLILKKSMSLLVPPSGNDVGGDNRDEIDLIWFTSDLHQTLIVNIFGDWRKLNWRYMVLKISKDSIILIYKCSNMTAFYWFFIFDRFSSCLSISLYTVDWADTGQCNETWSNMILPRAYHIYLFSFLQNSYICMMLNRWIFNPI